jgi:tripartite ATP-independent transporter DctM subunit
MELVFLGILLLMMITALSSGFPVAFSLPGAAILSIGLAALCGYMFTGDSSSYFVEGGAIQWLNAGVTNFRSLYWNVERDTLIAVPLFIFMGIMLQRSKIAEDLLVAMAQMFGPVPGGLGISVVLVGALLAATTGIVGATVVAMGMISLPAMLRNNYSKPLATGTICASGTLGQIIPPSIVLIILADQLTSASDQASTIRKAAYKAATGEFTMPSILDVTSTSAGEMFMGALIPGLMLVGLYILYILFIAIVKPGSAPPVRYEGKYDGKFFVTIFMALTPPLTLILLVLGSIIMGVATVNQAGSVGAVGAIIMGGYRLYKGKQSTYYPAILAIASTIILGIILTFFDLNVKNIKEGDAIGIIMASVTVTMLLIAVIWSTWRIYKIENTLNDVMVETAKTTCMVFIILIGAAMLTAAFRGFGGEELVKEFLTGIKGGFWVQFIVVMAVMFVLGFFIDFLEIAVVVVPIVAPILLADPGANVTAVWFGVMVGLNLQTSFLTPPFGFALFYLRGVAPAIVKTLHIYRGTIPFIGLQVVALTIVAVSPIMVNYLPNRVALSSETAPPPINPRMQFCLEEYLFDYYDNQGEQLRGHINTLSAIDISTLPIKRQKELKESLEQALNTFDLVEKVYLAEADLAAYLPEYRPHHEYARGLQTKIRNIRKEVVNLKMNWTRFSRSDSPNKESLSLIKAKIEKKEASMAKLKTQIPETWPGIRKLYVKLENDEKKARQNYRNNVDKAYETIPELQKVISGADELASLEQELTALETIIVNEPGKVAMDRIKESERALGRVAGTSSIKSKLYKARRAIKGKKPNPEKAVLLLKEGLNLYAAEVDWRKRATAKIAPALLAYDNAIKDSIGIRMQRRLSPDQIKSVARCQSIHRDFSLQF